MKPIVLTLSLVLASGCGIADPVGTAEQHLDGQNALSLNALSLNALSLNALSLNALSLNALSLNSFELNTVGSEGLEQSEDGRHTLLYLVRCALPADKFLVFEVDGVLYTFPGSFGLARRWLDRGLSESDQRSVSACLFAHANNFGVSVPISARAPIATTKAEETKRYQIYEATFFGNVFGATPALYACWGIPPEDALALSEDRALRVCSDPISKSNDATECSTTDVDARNEAGMCEAACATFATSMGWHNCSAGGQVWKETMSVWLKGTADGTKAKKR